jgi:UDP-glucose 4-epimerase
MRVVITGASGNLGSALLRRLRGEPGIEEIVAVCRRPPPTRELVQPGVRWVRADVSTDELDPIFEDAEALVHLAWAVQPVRDADHLARVNIEGSRRTFDAALRAGIRSIVHASSHAAYWPAPRRMQVDEHWPVEGVSASSYSRHKMLVERQLDRLELDHPEVRVVRMRPAAIVQREIASPIALQFFGRLVARGGLSRRLLPILPLPAATAVQVVHADDAADAYARALLSGARGAYNLAAEPVLDRERLAQVIHVQPWPLPVWAVNAASRMAWRLHRQGNDPSWLVLLEQAALVDAGRARAELGWEPRWSADEALAEALGGARDRYWGATPTH